VLRLVDAPFAKLRRGDSLDPEDYTNLNLIVRSFLFQGEKYFFRLDLQ
jgi:hypothetical protein